MPQLDPDTSGELGGDLTPYDTAYGGNVGDSESGCEIDGIRLLNCSLFHIFRDLRDVRVQARYQGYEGRGTSPFLIRDITRERTDVTFCDNDGNNCGATDFGETIEFATNRYGFLNNTQIQRRTPSKKQRIIDETVDLARIILNGDNSCSKFFGKGAVEVLNSLGKGLTPNSGRGITTVGISLSKSTTIDSQTADGRNFYSLSFGNVWEQGAFFLPNGFVDGFVSNSDAGRIMQVFHELAHLLSAKSSNAGHLLPWDADGGNNAASNRNTWFIGLHCRNEINKLLKNGFLFLTDDNTNTNTNSG